MLIYMCMMIICCKFPNIPPQISECVTTCMFSVWFSSSRRKLALPPTCAQVIPISRPSSGKKCPDFCQNRLFKELVNYGLHVLIPGTMKELVWHLGEMYVMKVLYPNTQFHFIV